MLKIGVGAGHLGKIHLRLLQQSEKYELVGFYDPNQENADKISKEFGYKHFSTIATLIHAVDVIDIVTQLFPITNVQSCHQIRQTRFYRKPISNTIEEAEEIITLANEYNVKDKGHVERFNPAFIATKT
jgi:predicted dehydrogenase